eukprot:4977170-Pyramimonas_sp.AAC.1
MGTRGILANVKRQCAQREGESHILKTGHPQSVKRLQIFKRRYAALRREAQFEKGSPSIREVLAH